MRRRFLIGLALLTLLATEAWTQRLFFTNNAVSVTQSNSAVSFTDNGSGGSSVAFLARRVVIYSLTTSANTCYFDLKDTTATVADIAIDPGGTWQWDFIEVAGSSTSGWAGLGAICDTAQTATFRVTATR